MRAEGFFCSSGVLYGGLGISKLQFLIQKINIKISSCQFFSILDHQTRIRIRDPESGSAIRKNAGSGSIFGSALNQCGSATLVLRTKYTSHFYVLSLSLCLIVLETVLLRHVIPRLLVQEVRVVARARPAPALQKEEKTKTNQEWTLGKIGQ